MHKGLLLGVVLLITLPPLAQHVDLPEQFSPVAEVEAQALNGQCAIEAQPSAVTIDVSPGASGIGISLITVHNPTQWSEQIEIGIDFGGRQEIAYAYQQFVNVPPYSSFSFDLALKAYPRTNHEAIDGTLTCTVTRINGAPNPDSTTSQTNLLAVIKQYALLRVTVDPPFTELGQKKDLTLTFTVYNDGNWIDKIFIEVENYDALVREGFVITIPENNIDIQGNNKSTVQIQLRTPKKQGWVDEYFLLNVKFYSDYSAKFEDALEQKFSAVTVYVRGIYLPAPALPFVLLPLLFVALMLAARSGSLSRASTADAYHRIADLDRASR